MSAPKWIMLVIYAAMAACLVLMPGTQAAQIISWTFIILLVVHVLEAIAMFRVLSAAPGSLAGHIVQTLLFGIVHWKPLRQQQS